jgi:hypothetical protein
MKLFATVLIASVFASPIAAVAQGRKDISVSYNVRGRLARVFNMNDDLRSDFTCQIVTYTGTIAALRYSDGGTEPVAIIVEIKNGRRIFIALDENLYRSLSEADTSHVESSIVRGRRVRISAFRCGAGGRGDLQASSIVFL